MCWGPCWGPPSTLCSWLLVAGFRLHEKEALRLLLQKPVCVSLHVLRQTLSSLSPALFPAHLVLPPLG